MFGFKYKYAIDETKNVITLRPTKGAYITSAVIGILGCVAVTVLVAVDEARERREFDKNYKGE